MSASYGAPQIVYYKPLKSAGAAYALLLLLGGFGAHRYYLGRPFSATVMLLITLASFALVIALTPGSGLIIAVVWVWMFVDLFLVPGMVRAANTRMVATARQGSGA